MIAKCKLAILLGTFALLAGCAQSPPAVYYLPPSPDYAAPLPPAPSYDYAPTPKRAATANPSLPETESRRRESAPPVVPPSADDCVGWWRICQFLGS
jgi:hypothetical protein